MTFITVGHSNRSLESFLALLRPAGIGLLADVRQWPRSRRHPQFNSESLAPALLPLGIEYRHFPALGGRRGRDPAADPEANALWREPAFHNFADYANTEAFRAGLRHLIDASAGRICALMCAEAVWWRCHRRIIADHLLAAGHAVEHLMAPGRRETARLTPGAQPQPDGRVLYPAPARLL